MKVDKEKLRRYWIGKSPTVRKAVEEYLASLQRLGEILYPQKTIGEVAKANGVSDLAMRKNINNLMRLGLIEEFSPSWVPKKREEAKT